MKKNTGFTLIELLVVIAIIGILSSVVLASLNTARNKGADAAIKENLANLRAQAEIYYDANGKYGANSTAVDGTSTAACNTASTVFSSASTPSLNPGIVAASTSGTQATCSMTIQGTAWAVSVPLKALAGSSWCVDSTGASKVGTASGGQCN
jgi:prepilin-type N-terminal cleavage/methylation domain-containing protein